MMKWENKYKDDALNSPKLCESFFFFFYIIIINWEERKAYIGQCIIPPTSPSLANTEYVMLVPASFVSKAMLRFVK